MKISIFFHKDVVLSHLGRVLFIVDNSYVKVAHSFVKFDKISHGLQVHDMKAVTSIPPQSSMHSENNMKCTKPQSSILTSHSQL